MDRAELVQWVEHLGKEFARRGMATHAQKLRVYFLALTKHLVPRNGELNVHWTSQLVQDWMKTLQLPPFDKSLPVRPPGAPCTHCSRTPHAQPSVRTECVFNGGARMRCDSCGALWLVHDPPRTCKTFNDA